MRSGRARARHASLRFFGADQALRIEMPRKECSDTAIYGCQGFAVIIGCTQRNQVEPYPLDHGSNRTRNPHGVSAIASLGQQRPADCFQCVIVVLVLSATDLLEQRTTLRLAPERAPGRQP